MVLYNSSAVYYIMSYYSFIISYHIISCSGYTYIYIYIIHISICMLLMLLLSIMMFVKILYIFKIPCSIISSSAVGTGGRGASASPPAWAASRDSPIKKFKDRFKFKAKACGYSSKGGAVGRGCSGWG